MSSRHGTVQRPKTHAQPPAISLERRKKHVQYNTTSRLCSRTPLPVEYDADETTSELHVHDVVYI